MAQVEVVVAVADGARVVAIMTGQSAEELDLRVGVAATVGVNARSVIVQ